MVSFLIQCIVICYHCYSFSGPSCSKFDLSELLQDSSSISLPYPHWSSAHPGFLAQSDIRAHLVAQSSSRHVLQWTLVLFCGWWTLEMVTGGSCVFIATGMSLARALSGRKTRRYLSFFFFVKSRIHTRQSQDFSTVPLHICIFFLGQWEPWFSTVWIHLFILYIT